MSQSDTKHYDSHDAGDGWGTPPRIVDPLSEALGGFDLDPCSGAEPKPYADTRFTKEDDGYAQEWFGDVWFNPPYGKKENPKWAEKCHQESKRDAVTSITALVPASVDTQWFQNYYAEADVLTFHEGGVDFIGDKEYGPSFASAICTFGMEELPREYLSELRELGEVYPNTEQVLIGLLENGCTPAEALDSYFTDYAGFSYTQWAETRGVTKSAVFQNTSE